MLTSPEEGLLSVPRMRMSVVLPAPLGPKMVRNSPWDTSRLTSRRAHLAPKRLDRPRTVIMVRKV